MTNCVCNLLRGIGSFLVGSLRMILFFGCLLFAIAEIISLVMLLNIDVIDDLQLPKTQYTSSTYVQTLLLLALALLGCYGAFYKHHLSLKVFSALSALSVIIMVVMLLYIASPEDWKKDNDKFAERISDLAPKYSWTAHSTILYSPKEADRVWDKLQKLFCCGVNGPDDWNQYRPALLPDDFYPSSCCFPLKGEFCRKRDAFKTGCMARIQEIEAISITVTCLFLVYHFALCVMAGIVGTIDLENRPESRSTQSGNSTRSGELPAEYQRFEGSVYVRQPPVNEHFKPSTKADLPPLYPNIQDLERGYSTAPPPSYGTST